MAGDMPSRMDWLVEKFSGLDTITEFGHYQGCSTAAWLKCKPKNLITIDIGLHLDQKEYQKIAEENGISFQCIIASSVEIDIEPTDLLFIDTMHTKEHTYLELKKNSNKVKKYLAFHDVNPKRFGTQEGIDQWLIEEDIKWKTLYHDVEDCGFLVLEKD